MRDIIGKYKGIPVYKITLPEYVNGRLYKDEDNMFLIDGELIYKNVIFARYDGNCVTEYDPHERATYYTVPAIKVRTPEEPLTSSIGTADRDTNSETETEIPETSKVPDFEFKTVDEILAGSLGSEATNYFSGMTDIDAFLRNELKI